MLFPLEEVELLSDKICLEGCATFFVGGFAPIPFVSSLISFVLHQRCWEGVKLRGTLRVRIKLLWNG